MSLQKMFCFWNFARKYLIKKWWPVFRCWLCTYVVQPWNVVDGRICGDIADKVNIVTLFDIGRVNVDAQFSVGGRHVWKFRK